MNWFIFIFSCIISVVATYFGIRLTALYLKVKKWSNVNARVLKKEIVPLRLASASRNTSTLRVEYEYNYNFTTYSNNKVFLVELIRGEKGILRKAIKKYYDKIGEEITVFINPVDPKQSVIFCEDLVWYLVSLIIGLMSFIIGLAQLI